MESHSAVVIYLWLPLPVTGTLAGSRWVNNLHLRFYLPSVNISRLPAWAGTSGFCIVDHVAHNFEIQNRLHHHSLNRSIIKHTQALRERLQTPGRAAAAKDTTRHSYLGLCECSLPKRLWWMTLMIFASPASPSTKPASNDNEYDANTTKALAGWMVHTIALQKDDDVYKTVHDNFPALLSLRVVWWEWSKKHHSRQRNVPGYRNSREARVACRKFDIFI